MSLNDGLTKKEGFKPESSSPPATKTGRPKHDNKMIKRQVKKPKC